MLKGYESRLPTVAKRVEKQVSNAIDVQYDPSPFVEDETLGELDDQEDTPATAGNREFLEDPYTAPGKAIASGDGSAALTDDAEKAQDDVVLRAGTVEDHIPNASGAGEVPEGRYAASNQVPVSVANSFRPELPGQERQMQGQAAIPIGSAAQRVSAPPGRNGTNGGLYATSGEGADVLLDSTLSARAGQKRKVAENVLPAVKKSKERHEVGIAPKATPQASSQAQISTTQPTGATSRSAPALYKADPGAVVTRKQDAVEEGKDIREKLWTLLDKAKAKVQDAESLGRSGRAQGRYYAYLGLMTVFTFGLQNSTELAGKKGKYWRNLVICYPDRERVFHLGAMNVVRDLTLLLEAYDRLLTGEIRQGVALYGLEDVAKTLHDFVQRLYWFPQRTNLKDKRKTAEEECGEDDMTYMRFKDPMLFIDPSELGDLDDSGNADLVAWEARYLMERVNGFQASLVDAREEKVQGGARIVALSTR